VAAKAPQRRPGRPRAGSERICRRRRVRFPIRVNTGPMIVATGRRQRGGRPAARGTCCPVVAVAGAARGARRPRSPEQRAAGGRAAFSRWSNHAGAARSASNPRSSEQSRGRREDGQQLLRRRGQGQSSRSGSWIGAVRRGQVGLGSNVCP
jgi:hypothetical protein